MQLDIEHFNKLAQIVSVVESAGGENVSVAGGAVRDSVLEKPIADIDVFYQGEIDKELIEKVFGKKIETEELDELPYDKTFSVEGYKGDSFSFNGMKVQLINVVDVDKHIAEFPCYLSRMMFSEGCLLIPIEALQDASLKIVRFTDDCNEEYKEKISNKYEDYL